jgi:hypothetical protein
MTRPRAVSRSRLKTAADPFRRFEIAIAAGLLLLHLMLAVWVARVNSVTFDENFHVPAGVRIVRAADFATSYAQPPLPKTLYGLAAIAAGARDPDSTLAAPGAERFVGYSFMRRNEDRYQRVYQAARLVGALFSVALAFLVWRTARAWFGPRGGLFALVTFTLLPEVLAQAGVAGVDAPTALTFFGATLAWLAFVRTGRWRRFGIAAVWVAAAFLTRFSAVQLLPAFAVIAAVAQGLGRAPRPARTWIGFALLPVVAVLALDAGYLFQVSMTPLAKIELHSASFLRLQHAFPGLGLPLPDAWISGMDYLSFLSEPGKKASYLLGEVRTTHAWWYFPVALAVKWPLAWIALLVWRGVVLLRDRRGARAAMREVALLAPAATTLAVGMLTSLDFGVRYLAPMLPLLAVWAGRLASSRRPQLASPRMAMASASLLALLAVETASAMPYPLAFFNRAAGGRGDRIVNDSNVDWGQGLVALREEMRRRGIAKIHLLYHGTTDPALYGIDYTLYTGERPGPESDWFAVSSYFLVGLPARLTASQGMTQEPVRFDLGVLRTRPPVARPAGAMYLFKIR